MIFNLHRTTFYIKHKSRKYKYEKYKSIILKLFYEHKPIYGSGKLVKLLEKQGIIINDWTLRYYMVRWNIKSTTRIAKRNRENKNLITKINDHVKRNYNPELDNIIATDVSYIRANCKQNFVYLSAAISHKTKLIESWKISDTNNLKLVNDTIINLNRKNFILHSDDGFQYSSYEFTLLLKQKHVKQSMSRIGNCLDNREIEYFFGCLKGEYLNKINTSKMTIKQIEEKVAWYINWYNNVRIQKRLHWHTPRDVSSYAI